MKKIALAVLAVSAVAFAGGDVAPACNTCDGSALSVIAALAVSAISVAAVAFKK